MGYAARCNPRSQLSKEGKLPPKKRKRSKRESEHLILQEINKIFFNKLVSGYRKSGMISERRNPHE